MKQRLCIGFWLGMGILTLSGCSRAADEESGPAEGIALQVAGVNIGSGLVTTRADRQLAAGAAIGFKTTGTAGSDNVCYRHGTPYWKAANPSETILLSNTTGYCAYYPWRSGVDMTRISMTALPSSAEEQELSYLENTAPAKGTVTLNLKRAYCKINLAIEWKNAAASDRITSISLEKTNMPATATLDAATGSITTTAYTGRLTTAVDFTPAKLTDGKVSTSIFVCPMNLEDAQVSIVLNGKILTASLAKAGAIDRGKYYDITIPLNARSLAIGAVASKPSPTNWAEETLDGGDLKP